MIKSDNCYNKETNTHYDSVTEAWRHIFGDCFHLGFFNSDSMKLSEATVKLIDVMALFGDISKKCRVLDVGCGIGGPAFYLHEKYGCKVEGITTSSKGIYLAEKERTLRKCSEDVHFTLADALENGFSDQYFDVIWVMESSHLIKKKVDLFKENFRVLKDGGTILICDMILKRNITIFDIMKWKEEINLMEKVFGNAKTETLEYYSHVLSLAGFDNVVTNDISEHAYPTMKHWRKNIFNKRNKIQRYFSDRQIEEFLYACEILEMFYEKKILGYGMIRAVKT